MSCVYLMRAVNLLPFGRSTARASVYRMRYPRPTQRILDPNRWCWSTRAGQLHVVAHARHAQGRITSNALGARNSVTLDDHTAVLMRG
ncbi:hypothetical protein EVAR_58837_1 [Eumeta japonica]|uniref:Uncharacterized protein n=1 Tax=Eumeta variegata TaxID=151549 RepID=A0A4C1YWQ9_EUMVA|nr:hypothetical protein EVAR_58837_1 [Eumeta japonica]